MWGVGLGGREVVLRTCPLVAGPTRGVSLGAVADDPGSTADEVELFISDLPVSAVPHPVNLNPHFPALPVACAKS